ncbi:MAG: helix-turn-helix domain-containing protein [Psychromonas sp.]
MTLEQALKEHRIAANLTIEELAFKLNLKITVINDIENDLEQAIEDKRYPVIYLRGYLANYAKAVQLAEIESFPEYQQLSRPSKSNNTLSNPYLLSTKKKSSNKLGWFVLIVFVAAVAGTISQWDSIVDALYKETSVDTENIHMRLPEPDNSNAIDPLNQQPELVEDNLVLESAPEAMSSEADITIEDTPQ